MIVSTHTSNSIAKLTVPIQGFVAPGFEPVREVFHSLWDEVEVGAALHVSMQGEPIVDLWGGHLDQQATKPWQSDSLACIYSATKGIVALTLACLVQDGLLAYDDTVAKYWPEFGAEGKFDITVGDVLAHRAGLHQFEPAIEVDELLNWQNRVMQLAGQRPRPLGANPFCYHAISWGYLAGELIRRATGKSPGACIRERLSGAIDADCFVSLSAEEQLRCADIIGPNRARQPMPSPPAREDRRSIKTNDPVITPFRHICSPAWRVAEVPSTNGHASARGLAGCYQAALQGNLLDQEILIQATTPIAEGIDPVLGQHLRRSMGFIVNSPDCWYGPGKRAFGHSGTGGSIGFADPDSGVAFGYVMNQLHVSGPHRSRQLIESLYRCL